MNQEKRSWVLKIDPPLPCSATAENGLCGKPATVATAWNTGIEWLIMPICRECTNATARLYGVMDLESEPQPAKEEPQDEN